MEKSIVEDLLRGSRNIDRMKAEVHRLVQMVTGLALRSSTRGSCVRFVSEIFENESCWWEVRGEIGSLYKPKSRIHVLCSIKRYHDAPHQKNFILTVGYCSETHVPFHSEHAQQVYQNMQVFVEGMVKAFPDIEDEMKIFLNASKVF
jgi:hypothetical protein